ncbi:hypothetical protein K1719_020916 [Acacia pycnantha]|nr:hypothetical protein K1719_020916 [Acacia pycnantha]
MCLPYGRRLLDEEEDEEKEEVANVRLVAEEEERQDKEVCDPTYDELLSEYNELHSEFNNIVRELVTSRKKNKLLKQQTKTSPPVSNCENPVCSENDTMPTYNELFAEYQLVQNEFDELAKNCLTLKRKNTTLEQQVENLSSPKISYVMNALFWKRQMRILQRLLKNSLKVVKC